MATFRLRHFSSPRVLRAIEPRRLLRFLQPYQEFFARRGCRLPATAEGGFDHERLVSAFMLPGDDSPQELLDALFLVDEMSNPEGMEALLDAAARESVALNGSDEQSPADVALEVWLVNRDLLERQHAEQFLFRPKTFVYYQTDRPEPPPFRELLPEVRSDLERALNGWFESKRRGRGARVFVYPDEHEVRFLVRHGEPFKREESLTSADVGSVCYRPLKYDVVVYDRRIGELRINAKLIGEKKLYREQFGLYLFNDVVCFPGTAKYSLEPLREDGADSLVCWDVPGIEWIKLTEAMFLWSGPHGEIEVHKATDLFAAFQARARRFPESPRLVKAAFKIKFTDSKTPRSVKIRPSNIAEYTRDADAALVEQWLWRRGFIVRQDAAKHEAFA